jgi:hypothetical protein
MDAAAMTRYITDTFADVETTSAYDYIFFFYASERKFPFATLATTDNEYDQVSNLSRPSVFRLNIGVSRDTYRAWFGPPPARAGADGVVQTGHDFTTLDQLMPHPVYAPQSWICILNPSDTTFQQTVQPLLAEAYDLARKRHARAHPSDEA